MSWHSQAQGTMTIALFNLPVCWALGNNSAPTCDGSALSNLLPCGVGHLQSNASPQTLFLSSAGERIARCWYRLPANSVYNDTTFPVVSDIALQSLVDPGPVPRLITHNHLHYPTKHSSWCSVTQSLIKAKSWCSCNIIIYKQVHKQMCACACLNPVL